MAIPIAVLDCDLLLHGRGCKTLDRFDLDSVSNDVLLSNFGFPRDFILYLVELLREVRIFMHCDVLKRTILRIVFTPCCVADSVQEDPEVQSHQS